MNNQVGKEILHYRILEQIGQGGMGVVYKAEDTKLKREVAIKFLPRQIAANQEERKRFEIEAQAAAALNNPNIATIHAIEVTEDDLFIVMEYLHGRNLKEVISSEGGQATSLDQILSYATQIAEGIETAHERGVVHRDIKSSNIMIIEKGQAKIMDFGLAKVRDGSDLTKKGVTLGTTAYMSPEQAQGESTDHLTDIWSFGVVLYEMLTGDLPFKGEYDQAVIYSILHEPPEPLAAACPDLPQKLVEIVNRALAKEPKARYKQMGDMLADLLAVRKDLNATQVARQPSLLKKSRWPIFLSGAALVGVLLVLAQLFMRPAEADRKSIAVLPFDNLSASPENLYFSNGMTEDIIMHLSQIAELRVISRTTSMRYRESEKSLR
ncbi:serine/threonine-protein kinase, partial [bacterium]|nr:serine/threonine-protein kinase [bacterium]